MNMVNVISDQKGNYILVLKLNNNILVKIPRFGNLELLAGFYFYCGSAHGNGGIRSRVARHLKINSKRVWHIDHIKSYMQVLEIWFQIDLANRECEFSQFLARQKSSRIPIKGFGASDCRKGCKSHLIMLPSSENLDVLYDELKKMFNELYRNFPRAV
jgi:Uri superfamily endonuclease